MDTNNDNNQYDPTAEHTHPVTNECGPLCPRWGYTQEGTPLSVMCRECSTWTPKNGLTGFDGKQVCPPCLKMLRTRENATKAVPSHNLWRLYYAMGAEQQDESRGTHGKVLDAACELLRVAITEFEREYDEPGQDADTDWAAWARDTMAILRVRDRQQDRLHGHIRDITDTELPPLMNTPRNAGHGHVFPRPDGVKARCGGPGVCNECARDLARSGQGLGNDNA